MSCTGDAVWADVAARVGSADDCKEPSVMISWADKALEAFDRKFSKFDVEGEDA